MKAGIRIGTMGMLTAGLLVGQMAFAEEGQDKGCGKGKGAGKQEHGTGECVSPGEGAGENKQEREKHREQMKARMEKHQEARKQLMEAVAAEEDAQKALVMVREHCVKQHEERSAFHASEMEKRMEMLGERLKNSEMDEAKREEILKKTVKDMEERKAKAEAHYAKLLADLDALKGKEDLTKKDILDTLRDARPEGMGMRKHDGKQGKECGKKMNQKPKKTESESPDA